MVGGKSQNWNCFWIKQGLNGKRKIQLSRNDEYIYFDKNLGYAFAKLFNVTLKLFFVVLLKKEKTLKNTDV